MMMKMVHHNHHRRPISPFDNDSCAGGGDGDGPTTSMSMSHHHNINDFVSGGSASPAVAALHSGGAAVRTLQPFDIPTRPAFKSPGEMAASLGFPFTNAQWMELERQAMVYKYMMASVPVPAHLLIPTPFTPASRSPLDSGFNLRLSSSSTDPEPGRCRRTDGKKWRCSRDVAPNHKYCERHMHRGRPRSRKPVEVQANSSSTTTNNQQNKRARQDYQHPFATSPVTVAVSNATITNGGSSSQYLPSTTSQPYHESSLSLDKYGVKHANFESLASVPSDSQPRGLDWMLKGDPISMAASDPEWQTLMQNKVGLTNQGSCNSASISSPNYDDTLYLNSYASFNSGLEQQNRRCPLFLNPLIVPVENPESQKPRGFIDAWSNTETGENNNANANKSPVSSNGKLSLSSLDLSMGGGGSVVDEEMGTSQMGLCLMEPDRNTEYSTKTHLACWLTPPAPWVGSTPGGPLAEVLRPSAVAALNDAASDPSSPVVTNAESGSPLGTMVSSPSGVLHKTLATLSDSSSNSSPTVASSRANSEIALLLFNKAKLASPN